MIILDTNVVSEPMTAAPNDQVMAWLDAQQPGSLWLTAITAAELLAGVIFLPEGRRRRSLEDDIARLLTEEFRDRVLAFDADAASHYAEAANLRRQAGLEIKPFDLQIAAIARLNGAIVATRNIRDFTTLGIELINPWS